MATKQEWEGLIERTREIDSDLAREYEEKFGATKLREQAEKVPDLERQVAELNAKATRLERAPQRDEAFKAYGVDIENLRPAERKAIESYEGELDTEKVAAFVAELDLPMTNGQQSGQDGGAQVPNAAGVVSAAKSAPSGGAAKGPQLNSEVMRSWTAEKIAAFEAKYPDELDRILQGETITGLTF
jgi:hypothetical protein